MAATCGGVRVWSLYVPNGRSLDDEHMPYKLEWLDTPEEPRRRLDLRESRGPGRPDGRLEHRPADEDVWDIDLFLTQGLTHVSEPSAPRSAPSKTAGFADVVRPYTPGPGVYTYWDYTQLRFPKKEGMRIDFVLASPALAARVTGASIDREERKGKGASDHAPVIVELAD